MSDVNPLAAEELADFMRDPGDAWENTKRHTNEYLGSIRATIIKRDERIKEMEGEDGIVDNSLNRLADRLVAAEAENKVLREDMAAALKLLRQSCGIIVEFGDLNGFRNLSNQELGSMVISVATAVGDFLNRVSPLTDEQKAAVISAKAALQPAGEK